MILVPDPDIKAATLMGRPASFGSKRGVNGMFFILERGFGSMDLWRIPPFPFVMPPYSEL
jgi:hypothetical protein